MTQLPDWFTRPESLFKTLLWVLSPFYSYFLGRPLLRRLDAWADARSEAVARQSLVYLHKSLDNPPTLLESLAFTICFLPIPICIVAMCFTLAFAPDPQWMPHAHLDPHTASSMLTGMAFVVSFCCYALFGVLTIRGIKTAYHLRHGQARYHANYKAGIQKRIDKLLKKFPQLRSEPAPQV
jgi:hypothetical protein